ncbi:MAG: ribosomal L7Ae/L30e/S12e/Gadd45 family protein [Candidatus Aenigmatarchaeota archaeon]
MLSLNQIKEAEKEKKLVIGSRTVIKGIKRGIIHSVIYASNCPETIRKDLEYYAKNLFISIRQFEGNSLQLGEACGKPFSVLLVGIKK